MTSSPGEKEAQAPSSTTPSKDQIASCEPVTSNGSNNMGMPSSLEKLYKDQEMKETIVNISMPVCCFWEVYGFRVELILLKKFIDNYHRLRFFRYLDEKLSQNNDGFSTLKIKK